ncbi:villin-5-like [Carex rostrata]
MSTSTGELDPAFEGAGKEPGLQIWRVENFHPVPVPKASYGKFFMGDSYIVLKTTATKSGALRHDIHYWLGKDTSQDEAGSVAILTVELDEALGGGPVQYREVQGDESEKFLSYFKPCIIPQPGGTASGFKHTEINAHELVTRLYQCKGVRVQEVPVEKSSLNHGDIFILDTQSKIYQFNGSDSSIRERGKAMEVVQHIKDLYHEGSCDIVTIADAEVADDAEASKFWEYFGGFGTISAQTSHEDNSKEEGPSAQLYNVQQGKPVPVDTESLTMDLLETNKCYLLESGLEIYVWMGKGTSLADKKGASKAAEELLHDPKRKKSRVVRVIEGYETGLFKSKFTGWAQGEEPEDD